MTQRAVGAQTDSSLASAVFVDRHLLEADFYLEALDENDAYSRVLDEFLGRSALACR